MAFSFSSSTSSSSPSTSLFGSNTATAAATANRTGSGFAGFSGGPSSSSFSSFGSVAQSGTNMFGSVPPAAAAPSVPNAPYPPTTTTLPVPSAFGTRTATVSRVAECPPHPKAAPISGTPPIKQEQQPGDSSPPKTPEKPAATQHKRDFRSRDAGVTFPSQKNTSFRYAFTTKDAKVKIWLEDQTSKQQWESKALALEEFVPSDRAIPMATLEDYVECFESCLSSPEGKEESARDLVQVAKGSDDALQLEITVSVQLFSRRLTPRYQFVLYALELNPMDVLTARIRDQEDELASVRAELAQLKTSCGLSSSGNPPSNVAREPVYFQAETDTSVDSGQKLLWKPRSEHKWFSLESPDKIRVLVDGVFVVLLAIKHTTVSNMFTSSSVMTSAFKLLKNDQSIVTSSDVTSNGGVQTSALQQICTLQKHDELSVLNSGNGYVKPESSIVIYMIR